MVNDLLTLATSKSKSATILSSLYNCCVGSVSFLCCFLIASVIGLVILFCFFNVMMFIISIVMAIIFFLSVLSGSAFVLFGGIFMIYTNYMQN